MKTFLREFWLFGIKQASACIFGGYLLFLIILTKLIYPTDAVLHRYDFLFLAAVSFQIFLLVFRLESLKEALVIIIFHIVATGMEIFKTSDAIRSWQYPESFVIGIGNVPLFAGFMYSAVGSYIARVWRIFDFRFTHYPRREFTFALAVLIYINFFSHHFFYDLRWILLTFAFLLFGRCRIYFKMDMKHRWMSLLLGQFLVALFIWFAENISTYAGIWLYPNQTEQWKMVSFSKLIAWFLLMLISFVLVTLVHRPEEMSDSW